MELLKTNVNYQTDINIGLIGIKKEAFEEELIKLGKTSFSKDYILDKERYNYGKYSKVSFRKINQRMILIPKDNIKNNINNDNLIINLFYCENNLENDKKKYYEEFLKEKLDIYFLFDSDKMDINFLNLIFKYSKGNYLKFNNNIQNMQDSIILNDYVLISDNQKNLNYNKFKFDIFLMNIISKFEMFRLFQKYSVEKNIVNFKDYLYKIQEYYKIKDEKEYIELFNKFEKFSFNNDYSDNTLILLQSMMYNPNKFNGNICFNVKSLECGFCTEKSNICEFDKNLKTFLCYRCRFNKSHYEQISKK